MKLGCGLYKHMLNDAHYRFAKQCRATHIIVHLVDYFGHEKNNKESANQPIGQKEGWGAAGDGKLWSLEYLLKIKREINSHGLELEGIENFDPAMWHDILLDGSQKESQIELIKQQR